jgi:hypothetical protein
MSNTALPPDRVRLADTRRRLGAHLDEAAELSSPRRLLTAGVDAVKTAAGTHVSDAMARVSTLATNSSRRPGALAMMAGGVGSLALALLARRFTGTRGLAHRAGLAAVLRPGSPWLGLAVTIATALLRPTTGVAQRR